MKFLIALFLFITFPVNAKEIANRSRPVKVFHKNNEIILEATNCDILYEQYDALSNWSENLGNNPSKTGSCFCTDFDQFSPIVSCRMLVTDIMPESVQKIYNRKTSFMGPNCFNTTLAANKILPSHRYTSPEEMEFWMNSPLCREKNYDEGPNEGDIIAIRRETNIDFKELHAFIYLTPELSLSKNSIAKSSKALLMSTDYVFDLFRVRKECQKEDVLNSQCTRAAQVFQCQQWDEYWKDYDFNQIQQESIEALEHIECVIEDKTLQNKKKYYDEFVKYNLNVLLRLAAENGSQASQDLFNPDYKKNPSSNEKKEDFFWDTMVFRIHSLFKQLKMVY